MEIVYKNISELQLNDANPRKIGKDAFAKLCESISSFPDMLKLRPIIVDADMIVLGGNMRLRACMELGIEQVPIMIAENLTKRQKKEFIVKDNLAYGEWDYDILANEWEMDLLTEWGVDVPLPQSLENNNEQDGIDYVQKMEVIVDCQSEQEQEQVYTMLVERGYKCRVLSI